MFSGIHLNREIDEKLEKLARLKKAFSHADAVVIGAGAGLSTAAGFEYSGERFERYFSDFKKKYDFHDMYSGGFYRYKTLEEYWAYWSRYIYVNRYMNAAKPVYEKLLRLVKDKDYFVITTNVDHCFQKAGFDKKRLFYTQGDYGLFQCTKPCTQETFDNAQDVKKMLEAQGCEFASDGSLIIPWNREPKMTIPAELVPHCPHCGRPMTMNLRADNKFAEDEGWHRAAECYSLFLQRHQNLKVLYLELGVGYNTPVIIKYPFWRYTEKNALSTYACINLGQAYAPESIMSRSICIDGNIDAVLNELMA